MRRRGFSIALFAFVSAASAGASKRRHAAAISAELAISLLPSIASAPFQGTYSRFRSYHFETDDADFTKAYRDAFFKAVPKAVSLSNPWMVPFSGVMGPAELVSHAKETYLWVSSCRPHGCPDANVYVLYDPLRKTVWGVAHSDANVFAFGRPSALEGALLLDLVARQLIAFDAPLPPRPNVAAKLAHAIAESRGSVAALIHRYAL
jgi:hypothetical protein